MWYTKDDLKTVGEPGYKSGLVPIFFWLLLSSVDLS
jgi:hypothetical protein